MGSSKATHQPRHPGVYRDEPDRDDASTSSAVLLEDIDEPTYPDEELPAYTDHPTSSLVPGLDTSSGPRDPLHYHYEPPPQLPFSSHGLGCREFRTRFPNYSTSANDLYQMISEQARYPPPYFVQLYGTHNETRRNGNKETKDKVTDFLLRINLTNLIDPNPSHQLDAQIELLPENKRGYRGGCIPKMNPTGSANDVEAVPEQNEELKAWCERFVADKSSVKSFTLQRKIINHDTKKLEQLLRSAIAETNYRGHLTVEYPMQNEKVIVYSPGLINQWRTTLWIRWVFYLTFLWIFAWPFLIFMTARYEVVKAIYPYASRSAEEGDVGRQCTVMSEVDWYYRWESAVRRAALARMNCKDAVLSEEYRESTVRADQRGEAYTRAQISSTGNAFADGALGLLGQGLRVASDFNNSRGWGGDC